MGAVLAQAIDWFAEIITWILLFRAILSWFIMGNNMTIKKLYMFTVNMTEPFVAPVRQFMSRFNTGMIDLSIFISFLLVRFAANILISLVQIIM